MRLINHEGQMVGIKPIHEALKLAEETGYDLIEIVANSVPPVCKLGNYSKFVYEKEKKAKDARKSKSAGQVKEIRFRPRIGEHDFNFKVNNIVKFLKDKHKVRVSIVFFGREMEHTDLATGMVQKLEVGIQGVGIMEQKPQMLGNRLILTLVPHKG